MAMVKGVCIYLHHGVWRAKKVSRATKGVPEEREGAFI